MFSRISIPSLVILATALLATLTTVVDSEVVSVYYPDWRQKDMPVDKIPFEKITHLNYAFALLDKSYAVSFTSQDLLKQVVAKAKKSQVKVILSVGGWSGSQYFSSMAKSPDSRKKAIDGMVNAVSEYQLDGLDVDWEYPGRKGSECNEEPDIQNDSKNLLLLLQELRKALDTKFGAGKILITMAVRVEPFDGPNGPLTDVSEYGKVLDYINVMAYDIYGGWSETTGANAPFNYDSKNADQVKYSFVQSIEAWTKAKFPADRIVAGLAAYGRAMSTTSPMDGKSQNMKRKAMDYTRGDSDDSNEQPSCAKDPAVYSGVWKYRSLISQGIVDKNNKTSPDWTYHWDNVTQTPWLYNEKNKTMISYDDIYSLGIKAQYAIEKQLAGVMMWEITQDNGDLIESVQIVRGDSGGSVENPTVLGNECGDSETSYSELPNSKSGNDTALNPALPNSENAEQQIIQDDEKGNNTASNPILPQSE
ncbi:hypothetical protein IWQ62_002422 [Dispira parvispora]|uniref:GH18 domain-containing protein n=1 Tax=Dispira parvispora TaxID=1520584 RepID=A0A9W8AQE2_9FUNG|nr:hypothetical protein IWQ62_002422 [Dispira parvispora]